MISMAFWTHFYKAQESKLGERLLEAGWGLPPTSFLVGNRCFLALSCALFQDILSGREAVGVGTGGSQDDRLGGEDLASRCLPAVSPCFSAPHLNPTVPLGLWRLASFLPIKWRCCLQFSHAAGAGRLPRFL